MWEFEVSNCLSAAFAYGNSHNLYSSQPLPILKNLKSGLWWTEHYPISLDGDGVSNAFWQFASYPNM